jgi:predicted transcriptional regulator
MKIVWRLDTATVRDVYETLRKRRQIAYTTVMTTMKILTEKGFLTKRLDGRAYHYRATKAQHTVETFMVHQFVDRVFNGASRPLLLHLVERGPHRCGAHRAGPDDQGDQVMDVFAGNLVIFSLQIGVVVGIAGLSAALVSLPATTLLM